MKNIPISKICLMLIVVFAVHLTSAQDAPTPATAPAYEAPAKTKKKKRGTVPVAPPAVVETTTDTQPAATPEKETEGVPVWGEETASEEDLSKKQDDEFRHNIDLLTLHGFLGDLKPAPERLIRKERFESIYSSSVKFENAIDNYIGQGIGTYMFVAVFYQGNERAESEKKFKEITERAIRVKPDDTWFDEGRQSYDRKEIYFGIQSPNVFWGGNYRIEWVLNRDQTYEVVLRYYFNVQVKYLQLTGSSDESVFAGELKRYFISGMTGFSSLKGTTIKEYAETGTKVYNVTTPFKASKNCTIDLSELNFRKGCTCQMYESAYADYAEKQFDEYLDKIIRALDNTFVYAKTEDLIAGSSLIKQYTFGQKKHKTYEESVPVIKLELQKTSKGNYSVEIFFPINKGF